MIQDGQDKKKGSIFSQQFAKSSAKDFGVEPVQTPIVEQPRCVSPGTWDYANLLCNYFFLLPDPQVIQEPLMVCFI